MDGVAVRFGVLGPLAVWVEDGLRPLGGRKPRAVLAVLLLARGRAVSADRLLDEVWGSDAPDRLPSLQVYVSSLRRLIGRERLVTGPSGYRLLVGPEELDSTRFEALAERGREALAAGRPEQAREALRSGLALWRGPVLDDLRDEPFARAEVTRLGQLRLSAVEDRVDADLALGRHSDVAAEVEALVGQHPTRERLWGQLMTALYRSGRQADALRAYGRAREVLVEEYGIDPGPALRELERSVLAQDPVLAAPVVTASVPPDTSLPLALTPLLGREADVAAALDRLDRDGVRLVTVTGPGGTGKTRLALEVAKQWADRHQAAVWLVRLDALTDPAQVLPAIGTALGVGPAATGPVGAADVAAAIGGRPGLLVLDNLEHVLPAAREIAELLAATSALTVLATSRTCLRIAGEHERTLGPLALPDPDEPPRTEREAVRHSALALFLARTHAVGTRGPLDEGELATVADICRRLDGLPLALELAAARMKILSPDGIRTRLATLDLLSGGGPDLPGRQRTLRATLQWSYDLLSPAERRLLRRLSVFAGGFTLEAAESVCGTGATSPEGAGQGDADTLDALAVLVDSSLVRATSGGVRFRLLQTVKAFAAEQLAADTDERDDVRRRHLRTYLALADGSVDRLDRADGLVHLARLEAEIDNFRAGFEAARSLGVAEEGARLAVALRGYWLAQGRLLEGLAWLDEAGGWRLPAPLNARVAVAAGVLTYYVNDWDAARGRLDAAARLAGEQGDRPQEAVALCLLGAIDALRGSPTGGQALARRALALVEGLPEPYEPRVTALSVLALVAAVTGRPEEEKRCYEQRLVLVREHGDHQRTAGTLNDLAEISLAEGDLQLSRERAGEALDIARGRAAIHTRDALVTLGRVALLAGDTAGATASLLEAVALSARLQQGFGLAQALRALAAATQGAGEATRAATLFGAAEHLHPALRGAEGAYERDIEQALDRCRAALGAEAFGVAWSHGAAQAPDAVLVTALGADGARRTRRT